MTTSCVICPSSIEDINSFLDSVFVIATGIEKSESGYDKPADIVLMDQNIELKYEVNVG
jgi:hypothetical protein